MKERPSCSECGDGELIRSLLGQIGDIEAHVQSAPPLVANIWTEQFTCPRCGVTWYAEPTSEQKAAWIRDQVP